MLPVSLDCPFLTATSVFSNVYLSSQEWTIQRHWQEKTEGEVKNGQSRDTGNIGQTRHRTNKRRRKLKGRSRMDNPETLVTLVVSAPPPPGLSILDCCPIGFLLRLFVLCLVCPMLSVSLNCPLYTAPSVSVYKNVYVYLLECSLFNIKMIFYLFIYWVK
jgi:hypothetical protein